MKKTIFYDRHVSLGARIVEFGGYLMPVEYSGITDEHNAVRTSAGLFDVSHMGTVWVTGAKALEFVQWVTSNDASKLGPGKVQYSCLPNETGGIVDDLLVYNYDGQKYLLVVNASNKEKDWAWLNLQNKFGVKLENGFETVSQLALQGPKALQILQKLTALDVLSMQPFTVKTGTLAGCENVIISTTGYTGAGGVEICFYNTDGLKIFDAIMDAGKEFGLKPAGLGCRDTLRLEMGMALYGNDIDDTTSPIEANLGWITKFEPYKNFVNKAALQTQKEQGTTRKLVGIIMAEKAIPRHGYDITDAKGNKIGVVTSGTMSPTLKQGIGLAYVPTALSAVGSEVFVAIRGKLMKANVVKMPFLKKG